MKTTLFIFIVSVRLAVNISGYFDESMQMEWMRTVYLENIVSNAFVLSVFFVVTLLEILSIIFVLPKHNPNMIQSS